MMKARMKTIVTGADMSRANLRGADMRSPEARAFARPPATRAPGEGRALGSARAWTGEEISDALLCLAAVAGCFVLYALVAAFRPDLPAPHSHDGGITFHRHEPAAAFRRGGL